ncbi:hypothetical protein Pmar_PMAR004988 [Perkinsus marinus ATCC 50983]|uniref:Uncharacterized protein n=1 Tax=Perkinsus marinus (strain ATCC 50983 / TXsc) TaxID=423536 RepID=C5KZT6_PERM5|nr:hypothetical protein Pmar_PMAR004988 [Perkinsus marinus ATCC 50983]EER10007.1 hypothetical protein Pmar_PMAR004988 [Perkinsus marinus ATCC 50983]|eukprot:XP_002778212.1 hypothetical protein Pmar_PMAR004988 [Perkinsus marinus ATCC 50983]
MTVKSSSEMQLTADVELDRGTNWAKCINAQFLYGLSKVFGKTNRSQNNVHILSQVGFIARPEESTDECLNEVAERVGLGDHCRWNAYPENGKMVLDGCDAHWDLGKVD